MPYPWWAGSALMATDYGMDDHGLSWLLLDDVLINGHNIQYIKNIGGQAFVVMNGTDGFYVDKTYEQVVAIWTAQWRQSLT